MLVQPLAANVPPAPVDGAGKVTETPGTEFPKVSLIATANGLAKAVLVLADWLFPDEIEIEAADPAVMVTVVVPQVLLPFLAVSVVEELAVSSP